MKRQILFVVAIVFMACSTEKEQMETVRDLAKQAVITQLQLPEGTIFNDKDVVITKGSDLEEIGATYIVTVKVISQNASGEEMVDTHTIEYVKVGEGGLSPNDYEIKSFK